MVAWGVTFKKKHRDLGTLLGWFPSVQQTERAGSVSKAGAWITQCMLGKQSERMKHKKREREAQAGRLEGYGEKVCERALLNPLKHPYIASTSSPSACKRQRMLSLGLVQKAQLKKTRRLHICLYGLLLIACLFSKLRRVCSVFNLSIPLNSTVTFVCLLISTNIKRKTRMLLLHFTTLRTHQAGTCVIKMNLTWSLMV